MMTGNPTLTLYTRVGCHLCEDMEQQLALFQQQYGLSVNVVDIDTDNSLKLHYGERVPVLAAGERELCHYYWDKDVVLEYFRVNNLPYAPL